MEQPKVVVVERRNYDHQEEYEEVIESWRGAGYRVAFRKRSSKPERDYAIMELPDMLPGATSTL